MIKNNNEIFITEEESKLCKLDNKMFNSSKKMIWHVRKTYNLNFENYILKAYYNDIRPTCLKTGNDLTFKASKLGPFFHNYSKNAFPRKPHTKDTKQKIKCGCEKTSIEKYGVKNIFSTTWCKNKIKNTIREKYGVNNPMNVDEFKKKMINTFFETIKNRPIKTYPSEKLDPNRPSSLELDFSKKLKEHNINFVSPFLYDGKRFDFYIPSINAIIEIDGEAYHKNNLEFLTLKTINGSRNDYSKNEIIDMTSYNFYRLRYDINNFEFKNITSLNNVINENNDFPDYNIKYKQKIVEKSYFEKYIGIKGKEKLKSYSYLLLKFIRTFQSSLPLPELEEDLGEVINRLSTMDVSKVYDESTKEFSNNISVVGHNYLKHYFHSYWRSKFNGNPSPEEAWLNDKIMQEVIDYRIGCNNSGEVFDFSLHQLIRGLSARRVTISFFKPLLAAAIYQHYLGNKENPIVLDPCCGFGGRLLGFKSKYPSGKYIGCEPNVETYNELIQLTKDAKWNGVEIYNCKFEDYVNSNGYNFDLVFTSIPYYDVEIYSNNTEYKSFEEWKNIFIGAIERYRGKNCYINAPRELCNKLGWNDINVYIRSNRSHFDKRDNKKLEPIIKL